MEFAQNALHELILIQFQGDVCKLMQTVNCGQSLEFALGVMMGILSSTNDNAD
jgi:hypothetical protein